jgi:hypothetical protein
MPAARCRFCVCLLHAAARVVWSCVASCVASVPCCALVVENNASHMLLVRCPLPAAHEMRQCRVFPCCSSHVLASSCISSAVCCTLPVACVAWVCRLLRGVCCMPHVALLPCCLVACCQWSFPKFHVVCCMCTLHAARCPLHAACCMLRCMTLLSAACCWKSGACCLLRVACRLLFAAYYPLHAACCLDVVCCTHCVVKCIFPVACCMSSVALSLMHVACRQLSVAHFPVVVCGIAARWIVSACPFFVACRTFCVACCLLPARVSRGVRCLSPVPRRISSRCTLHDARSLSHVVSCPLPVPSCTLSVACRLLRVAE